ncbi:hypothetical protein D9M72_562610 [compost metagenome]
MREVDERDDVVGTDRSHGFGDLARCLSILAAFGRENVLERDADAVAFCDLRHLRECVAFHLVEISGILSGGKLCCAGVMDENPRTKPVAQLEHRPHDLLLQMVVLAIHEVGYDLAVQRKLLEGVLLRRLGDALDTVFDDAAATDDLFAIDSDLAGVGSGLGNFAQGGVKARKIALARSITESHGGYDVVHHGFS